MKLNISQLQAWNYNARNTIPFYVSKISFTYLMTPIDSTHHQNKRSDAYQRKNLKLPHLHCYTRNI